MSKGKFKTPPAESGKRIKSFSGHTASEGVFNKKPKFSLEYLPHDREYCLSQCTDAEKVSFADRIHALSRMTWKEISAQHRHGYGYEIIRKESLNCKLPYHIIGDGSIQIYSMRFYGSAPMIGYRSNDGTFYIIAFDRRFKAYNHGSS